MAVTVEQLAAHLGRSVEDVLDACRQSGVLVWGASTPLDDREAGAVAARLGAVAPPPAPPAAPGAPTALPPAAPPAPPPAMGPSPEPFGPPPGSSWSAPPGPPPPPPPGAWTAPPQPWAATPPVPPGGFRPSRMGRMGRTGRVLAGVLAFLAFAGLRVGARTFLEDRDDERVTSEDLVDAGLGDETIGDLQTSDALRLGDCYVDPSGRILTEEESEQLSLRAVPCAEPHDGEVFYFTRLSHGPDDPYPGDTPLFDQAAPDCTAAFGSFVGTPYERSSLDFVVHFPSAQGWLFGDREVYCSAITIDGTQLTGTVEGSGR